MLVLLVLVLAQRDAVSTLTRRVEHLERMASAAAMSAASATGAQVRDEGHARHPKPEAQRAVDALEQVGARDAEPRVLPTPVPTPAAAGPTKPREPSRFAHVLAEHALSIAGGLFVLVATVLFLTYAINAGWINETLRTVLAGVLAAALVAVALRVAARLAPEERRGRAIGSLHGVLAGTAVAVAVIDLVVATRRYELIEPSVAFVAMLLVGAAALQLARVWRSQDLAAFGMVGMLAAPPVVDAPPSAATLALLAVALLVSLTCVVVEAWPRLGVLATLLTAPQLVAWIDQQPARDAGPALAVVLAWWTAIHAAMIVPCLVDARRARRTSIIGACVAASFGALIAIDKWTTAAEHEGWWALLVGAFAALHLALGIALLGRRRSELVGITASLLAVAAALAAFAVFERADSTAEVAALVAEAVGVSALWWMARSRLAALTSVLLGAAAVAHILFGGAPPGEIWDADGRDVVLAPLAVLAGALVALRMSWLPVAQALLDSQREPGDGHAPAVRRALLVLAVIAGWYAGALALVQILMPEGEVNTVASSFVVLWTVAASLLAAWLAGARRHPELVVLAGLVALAATSLTSEVPSGPTSPTLLLAAIAATLVLAALQAPWIATWVVLGWYLLVGTILLLVGDANPRHVLATGIEELGPSSGLLLGYAAAFVATTLVVRRRTEQRDLVILTAAVSGVAITYAVSALVVRALTSPPGSVQQDAQVALSVTWAVLGLALLAVGTRMRQHAVVRVGGYVLLACSAAKVVLVDTAQLETPFRVAVFFGVGLLLLVGAHLEQVLRSRDAS